MAAQQKNNRRVATIYSLIGAVIFSFLLGGCADVQYAHNEFRSPEAKYNTFYGPDYYPYFPWDGYYGGAYYYGNEAADSKTVVAVSDQPIQ